MEKKRILITGKGSYVGTSFMNWVKQWPDQYEVEELSVRGEAWKEHDFSAYDVVLHVAGIAHVSTDPSMEQEYYRVNRDLTIEVASKAKQDGVGQFIFMSSIIVYEDNGKVTFINSDTPATPSNFYGKSKLQAEKGIRALEEETFKIAILRPPMIYGKDSKGNYRKMAQISRKIRFFPDFNNKRSMLHIDNLCELLRFIIINEDNGFFYPQNKQYSSTTEMVRQISLVHGNKIYFTKLFNPVIKITMKKINAFRKIFGDLIYDQRISTYKENYQIRTLKESIKLTENMNGNETVN
ncbi:NAD-dependent epimerase/dehydratase family protein [Paenibacillus piscarius]|uniref:NAD-dependent epimerase/dehydratase family protein n=1 Tax=Paenibacillus piscarius TaxID=1089681 RepID=UPI001EE7B629|nr:NAD-dependent epimerase/dehydratase family protein [Paenibacillus piscarius]